MENKDIESRQDIHKKIDKSFKIEDLLAKILKYLSLDFKEKGLYNIYGNMYFLVEFENFIRFLITLDSKLNYDFIDKIKPPDINLILSMEEVNDLRKVITIFYEDFVSFIKSYEENYILDEKERSLRSIKHSLENIEKVIVDEHSRLVVSRAMASLIDDV
jgi:hypothetical protein